ncbi:hypothetical protein BIV57_17885 [Mangrovactinospora gilvigrisea]|uniref:Uncharacterized protein n=1 Tax=Mangrovactinospora gilvigrisea TaxID=1428644 RepID=A0A1J7C3H7_9ACTN|nr:hypothetical protein [Mangrovactinospora gilvigrisea]OIV36108.1 hypothetical protein BIV57_17885 [Mangrovactinospora gilvigrisea]
MQTLMLLIVVLASASIGSAAFYARTKGDSNSHAISGINDVIKRIRDHARGDEQQSRAAEVMAAHVLTFPGLTRHHRSFVNSLMSQSKRTKTSE